MNQEDHQATSVHFELHRSGKSGFQKYRELTVGKQSIFFLLKYEIITSLFANFPGALGFVFRRLFYKALVKKTGRGVIWGRGITLRHPHKIEIGDGVAVNDSVLFDAYGGEESGIHIGDNSLISREAVLNAKGGFIRIGSQTNIGMFSIIFARDCRVEIGDIVLMSAYCYLMGGGNHSIDRTDIPIAYQGAECLGIRIGDHAWLGAGVRVLDGCSIGRDSVIGTNSFINTDIPEFSIAAGVPARILKKRKDES